jgi:hypothetical protein
MLALEFGKSIVYLLPSRGEFEISNTTHVNHPRSFYKELTPLLVSNECQNATLTICGSFLRKCIEQTGGVSKHLSNSRRISLLRLEATPLDEVKETRFDSDGLLLLLSSL